MRIIVNPGRPLRRPEADLSDLTTSTPNGPRTWDGVVFDIPLIPEPSPAEQTRIRRRLMTDSPEQEAWVAEVVALISNLDASRLPPDVIRLIRLLTADIVRGFDAP